MGPCDEPEAVGEVDEASTELPVLLGSSALDVGSGVADMSEDAGEALFVLDSDELVGTGTVNTSVDGSGPVSAVLLGASSALLLSSLVGFGSGDAGGTLLLIELNQLDAGIDSGELLSDVTDSLSVVVSARSEVSVTLLDPSLVEVDAGAGNVGDAGGDASFVDSVELGNEVDCSGESDAEVELSPEMVDLDRSDHAAVDAGAGVDVEKTDDVLLV